MIQLFQQQQQEEEENSNQGEGGNYNAYDYAGDKKERKKEDSKSINISRISEVSHSKENSDPHANKNHSKANKREENKKISSSIADSHNPKLM